MLAGGNRHAHLCRHEGPYLGNITNRTHRIVRGTTRSFRENSCHPGIDGTACCAKQQTLATVADDLGKIGGLALCPCTRNGVGNLVTHKGTASNEELRRLGGDLKELGQRTHRLHGTHPRNGHQGDSIGDERNNATNGIGTATGIFHRTLQRVVERLRAQGIASDDVIGVPYRGGNLATKGVEQSRGDSIPRGLGKSLRAFLFKSLVPQVVDLRTKVLVLPPRHVVLDGAEI